MTLQKCIDYLDSLDTEYFLTLIESESELTAIHWMYHPEKQDTVTNLSLLNKSITYELENLDVVEDLSLESITIQ